MEFFWQEHCSGLPFPTPGDLPDPGIEPVSLESSALEGDSLSLCHPGTLKGLKYFPFEWWNKSSLCLSPFLFLSPTLPRDFSMCLIPFSSCALSLICFTYSYTWTFLAFSCTLWQTSGEAHSHILVSVNPHNLVELCEGLYYWESLILDIEQSNI